MEIITSKANEKVRLIRRLQDQRKIREREKLFVAEGTRLVEEAAAAGARARMILHDGHLGPRERSALNRLASAGGEAFETTPEVLRACSDTAAPSGLLAVLEWPEPPLPDVLEWVLVADGISNPGNLGSLLRAADAFGVQAALLAPGSVDAFNPKVVRGGMGAHLRLPIRMLDWDAIAALLKGFRIWLAEAREGLPPEQADWSGRTALVLGGEAAGPGEKARALATGSVRIPMRGKAESLNAAVAGGILMYEISRQMNLLREGR
ncbi:MAG: RNA methyltransferase [Anaerolineales bacterium]|nr:RNA methyltransferase [Anaerolineales bacterium]